MTAAAAPGEAIAWIRNLCPEGAKLRLDSRRIEPGDVFLAVPGLSVDGRSFFKAAAEKGAGAILYEAEGAEAFPLPEGVPALAVTGLACGLGAFASRYYGDPSGAMLGIAVTGTNGKTTTSQWMATLLTRAGRPCAALGTIGCSMVGRSYSSVPLTTPDPVTLQTLLHDVREDGGRAFALEASSIGLVQGRLSGTAIRFALFTNLTRDHLDYHKTMQAYEEAKALLFKWPGLEAAVINIDDPAGRRMCAVSRAAGVRVIAATSRGAEPPQGCELLEARNVRIGAEGVAFDLAWGGDVREVRAKVLGLFNVDNMIGAAGVMLAAGIGLDALVPMLEALDPPPGRLQRVSEAGMPLGVVDYCHTPDAVQKALESLRPVAQARGGKLWTLLGAGGNRDHGKRPIMGRIAAQYSDYLIVTSDNPRFEEPAEIARMVAEGAGHPRIVLDRAEAIREAVSQAAPEDVILVAGKGHEDYQEIRGVKHHFSDVEALRAAFEEKKHS